MREARVYQAAGCARIVSVVAGGHGYIGLQLLVDMRHLSDNVVYIVMLKVHRGWMLNVAVAIDVAMNILCGESHDY